MSQKGSRKNSLPLPRRQSGNSYSFLQKLHLFTKYNVLVLLNKVVLYTINTYRGGRWIMLPPDYHIDKL